MPQWDQPKISCGTVMAWGLANCTVEKFLHEYSKQKSRVGELYRTVLFSDSVASGKGEKLASKLEEYGDVVRSKKALNPIHGHKIQVFIWHPSESFITKELPKIVKSVEVVKVKLKPSFAQFDGPDY